MSSYLLLSYIYRDADNFKTGVTVALPGNLDVMDVSAISRKMNWMDGFVPGQVGLPDLQQDFNEGMTWWDEERDHPFHELTSITIARVPPRDARVLDLPAAELRDRIMGVREWDANYLPPFHEEMAARKEEYEHDPDAFDTRLKAWLFPEP